MLAADELRAARERRLEAARRLSKAKVLEEAFFKEFGVTVSMINEFNRAFMKSEGYYEPNPEKGKKIRLTVPSRYGSRKVLELDSTFHTRIGVEVAHQGFITGWLMVLLFIIIMTPAETGVYVL